MPQVSVDKLKQLIGNNRLDVVLQLLLGQSSILGNDLYNQVITYQAEYVNIEKETGRPFQDVTALERRKRELGFRFTSFLDQLPNSLELTDADYENVQQILHTPGISKPSIRKWVIILSILALSGVICYFAFCSTKPQPSSPGISSNSDTVQTVVPQPLDTGISDTAKTADQPKPVAPLKISKPMRMQEYGPRIIIENDSLPLAYIDRADQPGREAEINELRDACAYKFILTNPGKETVTIRDLFVEVTQYQKFPPLKKPVLIRPYNVIPVAYVVMQPRKGRYNKLFYYIDDKKEPWSDISLPPQGQESIGLRLNAAEPGVYSFRIGLKYTSADNDSLVTRFVPGGSFKWAFDRK